MIWKFVRRVLEMWYEADPYLTLLKINTENIKPEDVEYVANFLDVSEFEVFQQAYVYDTGKRFPDRAMEKYYINYLQSKQIPDFVVKYIRDNVNKCKELSENK